MKLAQILSTIEKALVASPTSYEAIANGSVKGVNWDASYMPESWIVASIMRALHEKNMAAVPEVNVRNDLESFESGGKRLTANEVPNLKKRGARIDLIIAEKSSVLDAMRLRVVVEIKGPQSNWQQFQSDIDRLRHFRKVLASDDQAVVFAYVSGPLTKSEYEKELHDLLQATSLQLSEFKISTASKKSMRPDRGSKSYIFMHVLRGRSPNSYKASSCQEVNLPYSRKKRVRFFRNGR
jgi:hypothetical protein